MSKPVLFAAAATLALTAGSALAVGMHPIASFAGANVDQIFPVGPRVKVLYNQNSNDNGGYINSQNYTSGTYTSSNDQGADDFIVPKGKTWKVMEVDVTGQYGGGLGNGPAASEDVYFYNDANGMPGTLVKSGSFTDLNGAGSPDFAISLGKKGVKLKPGHYWVSVVANCSYTGGCGQWGWEKNGKILNDPAMWQNPGGGDGANCPTWEDIGNCSTGAGDLMFELKGKERKKTQ